MAFVHLHTHSEYSSLDGMGRMGDLVAAAAADGNPALAITDHGTLGGIWKLGKAAADAGIKAIPGLEAYLAFGVRGSGDFIHVPADSETGDADEMTGGGRQGGTVMKKRYYQHITLLATSPEGWRSLVRIHNASQESYVSRYPTIDHALLRENAEGIIVLTGCVGGPVAGPLARGDVDEARRGLRALVEAVGKDNVYVEVMDHDIPEQHTAAPGLRTLATEFGLELVATNDAHFTRAEHDRAHEAWLALSTRAKLSDPRRFKFHGHGHHLRTETEMRALFDGADWWQRACDNTVAIAERVAPRVLPTFRQRLPKFPHPATYAGLEVTSSEQYLRLLVREGAIERYGTDPDRPGRLPAEVNDRLKWEHKVICDQGFADYFLIVHDVVTWARSDRGLPTPAHPSGKPGGKKPIRVGPGRGSAAGSVESYALGIVGVDPIANGLLFERFLDPERAGMPDIDVDFEKARRLEVLRYLAARWGRDRIAQIGTFGVSLSKASVKSAGRVLDQRRVADQLSKKIPANPKPLPFAELDVPGTQTAAWARALVDGGADASAIVAFARIFEGVISHPGVHACGVILSDEPLTDLIPLRANRAKGTAPDAPMISEWDGKDVESYGLLKLDVLGLRNLDVVSATLDYVAEAGGQRFDPDLLDPDDGSAQSGAAWALLRAGRTKGVFQMESEGMTALAQDAGPTCLDDLSAIVALYRPGPMAEGMHHRWAARKRGTEPVDYSIFTRDRAEQEVIAGVLDESMGILAFQEQAMRMGEVLAGFSAAEKNRLRKAISKKIQIEIDSLGTLWIQGAVRELRDEDGTVTKIAFSERTAGLVWDAIKGAAAYAFNKSHSTAYGFLAYVTAYLKANHPVEFAAALLATTSKADKRATVMFSLAADGIEVAAPDINASGALTRPVDGRVLIGLSEVSGVGVNGALVAEERERGGPFTSLYDVMNRVRAVKDGKVSPLPVSVLEALIEAGAFDQFGPRLGQMLVVRAARANPHVEPLDAEWGVLERTARQRARLGMITGRHPAAVFSAELRAATAAAGRGGVLSASQAAAVTREGRGHVVGVLAAWEERGYSGGRMASLTIEGSRGSVSGVMWDRSLQALEEVPRLGQLVGVDARLEVEEVEVVDETGETSVAQRVAMHASNITTYGVEDPWRRPEPNDSTISIPARVVSVPEVPVFVLDDVLDPVAALLAAMDGMGQDLVVAANDAPALAPGGAHLLVAHGRPLLAVAAVDVDPSALQMAVADVWAEDVATTAGPSWRALARVA